MGANRTTNWVHQNQSTQLLFVATGTTLPIIDVTWVVI